MAEELMNDSILKPLVVWQKDTSGIGKFLIAVPNLSCMHGAQVDSIHRLLQIRPHVFLE